MKTLRQWIVVGVLELIFCFWLLGFAANAVSSSSNLKVGLGVTCYLLGLLVIPGCSVGYVVLKVADAKHRQKQLKAAFPDDETTLLKLLDSRR